MNRSPARRLTAIPPQALQRPDVKLDNLAIVPASLLPNKVSYQKYANTLPRGQVLLIVPRNAGPAKQAALAKVAASLLQHGHGVRTLPQERFRAATPPPAGHRRPRHTSGSGDGCGRSRTGA
jgi:hypothetical protein